MHSHVVPPPAAIPSATHRAAARAAHGHTAHGRVRLIQHAKERGTLGLVGGHAETVLQAVRQLQVHRGAGICSRHAHA